MSHAPLPVAESGYPKNQIVSGLVALFAIYFAVSFYVQTIVVARPRMTADLDGMALYSWSISIPALAAAFATLLLSKFSDIYGRRLILMLSMGTFLAGTVLSAVSPTFPILIGATTLYRFGAGAALPLVFAVLGDMFAPAERSRWVGLLNIPQGTAALFGPTLAGWFVDQLSWRYLYWLGAPLIVACILLIPRGIPASTRKASAKIDTRGAVLIAIASSATILGFSFAGTTYPWASIQVIGLLGIALLFWILFFWAENHVDEPIMDPQVFQNRTFLTVAVAGLLSSFGLTGMMMYYSVLLQGVMGISATTYGKIITPFSLLMAFIGVPAGFALARTKRYKWMYIASYTLLTIVIAGITFFDAKTPVYMTAFAAILAGLGLGAIPTVNTMVAQCAVPRRLLGAAMGAIFFCISMGMAISPAVLGSVMDVSYAKSLEMTLPAALRQSADEATMKALRDPKALLSPTAMKYLQTRFNRTEDAGRRLFDQSVEAIRTSTQIAVRSTFLLGAVTMLLAFLLILTVPEISMDVSVADKKAPAKIAVEELAD